MIFHNSQFDFRKQKCTQIRSKIASKMAWLKFAAKTLQDASKTLTRRPKKLSDLPQDAPQTPQDASKTPQDLSKTLPSHPKPPPDNDFGTILRSLWKIFGRFFGRICRPTCLLKLTTVQLVIKHAARWRVRSFAALWIRTGPEAAQLRVWVCCKGVCRGL